VLDRHPGVDICISHGGGALPFLLGRFERASRVRPWASEELKEKGFSAALKRLWFDCHVHGPAAQSLLVETVGTDRLVFGTNFSGWDQGGALALDDVAPSLAGNARRLLRLDARG
jgi:aminocarboxymuconate-semialdehyde decarboxylase